MQSGEVRLTVVGTVLGAGDPEGLEQSVCKEVAGFWRRETKRLTPASWGACSGAGEPRRPQKHRCGLSSLGKCVCTCGSWKVS